MEEADSLSDRIMVLAEGRLRVIGTALYLKNKFGDGYRLSLTCKVSDSAEVKAQVAQYLPNSKILDERGGSILVGVLMEEASRLVPVMRVLEGKAEGKLKGLVNDWGVSLSTLEEVFMKVAYFFLSDPEVDHEELGAHLKTN
jgi:ABC-type multidrug transport system ATPase subunit